MDPAATDGELDIRLAIKERKTVPFRTPASPAAIRSVFMIEADQTLTAAACLQMTRSGHSVNDEVRQVGTAKKEFAYGPVQLDCPISIE